MSLSLFLFRSSIDFPRLRLPVREQIRRIVAPKRLRDGGPARRLLTRLPLHRALQRAADRVEVHLGQLVVLVPIKQHAVSVSQLLGHAP